MKADTAEKMRKWWKGRLDWNESIDTFSKKK